MAVGAPVPDVAIPIRGAGVGESSSRPTTPPRPLGGPFGSGAGPGSPSWACPRELAVAGGRGGDLTPAGALLLCPAAATGTQSGPSRHPPPSAGGSSSRSRPPDSGVREGEGKCPGLPESPTPLTSIPRRRPYCQSPQCIAATSRRPAQATSNAFGASGSKGGGGVIGFPWQPPAHSPECRSRRCAKESAPAFRSHFPPLSTRRRQRCSAGRREIARAH